MDKKLTCLADLLIPVEKNIRANTKYDYKEGKKRVLEILKNKMEIIENDKIPKDDAFTYDNGHYGWVTAIFVDMRDSSSLFASGDKEKISKIVRCFASEIIEILRDDDNLREIGIRGDCVYAVYTTPYKSDIYQCANKTFCINTYLNMLNKLLNQYGFQPVKAGIGMSTAKELVVKAGRKGTGINRTVWIGEAVAKASNLSSLGEKDFTSMEKALNSWRIFRERLVFSKSSYINFIDELKKAKSEAKNWFREEYYSKNEIIYCADIRDENFNDWINDGMRD
ncbi:MAG: hypothetical protein LBB59_08055 [Campylobacteraceae bacterium]|nr:hypothetical protein [Campylobacteraceae bacterium]